MSDKDRDDARAWRFVEGLMAADEIEEMARQPREERRAELKAAGIQPGGAKAALAKARAALDAPAPAAKVVSLDAARARRRAPTWTWVLAAAAVALLAIGLTQRETIVAWFSPTPTVPSVPTVPPVPTAPPQPSPEQLAAIWRDRAWRDCQRGYYSECSDEQDKANDLDPNGTSHHAADVAILLQDMNSERAERLGRLAKPGLGRSEKALPPRR